MGVPFLQDSLGIWVVFCCFFFTLKEWQWKILGENTDIELSIVMKKKVSGFQSSIVFDILE